jgi:hypothetical protein
MPILMMLIVVTQRAHRFFDSSRLDMLWKRSTVSTIFLVLYLFALRAAADGLHKLAQKGHLSRS